MSEDNSTLEYLVRHLVAAKRNEEELRAKRISIEEKIAALIPGPERGQITVSISDNVKVTVERGFNYKADCQGIAALFSSDFPEEHQPVKQKSTYELDVPGYEYYKDQKPDVFKVLSQFVTVTPKKISVQVKASK